MKILHVTQPFNGGVYTYLKTLINGLAENKENDLYLLYGANKDSDSENLKKIDKVVKYNEWKFIGREINVFKDTFALLNLFYMILRIQPDVIHLHSSKAGIHGRILSLFFWRCKFFYTPHGLPFLQKNYSYKKRKLFLFLEVMFSKTKTKLVACSMSEKKLLRRIGINSSVIEYGMNKLEAPRNNQNEKVYVGTCSRITYAKNPTKFNEIAEFFLDNPNVMFKWIGDGELQNILTSENIEVTGWKSQDELLNEIDGLDIYLSTSMWEGLPISVIEAMFLQLPLVLSNCIGNRDLIIKNENGYLYSSKSEGLSCLKKLIDDRIKGQACGSASLSIAEKRFSKQSMIKKYEKIYKL